MGGAGKCLQTRTDVAVDSITYVAVERKTSEAFVLTLRTWQLPSEIYLIHMSSHQFMIIEHAGMQDIDNTLCGKTDI